ncbi:Cof-type HAD-IIB family hydrolase [Metabacillus iocasae]|uniref:Cof subfamily protein (Haloacid dehalogenase superfamily) n=1 Tax=Priestia iocasae TaxID=2291674 RepID=A0ABS2QT25_9BACI|nr:Cof-type HAD-IIB family hydrolase [Metabacillus iocasae]MBM7702606.1 Cof subfamily protein (haloacid dehalogenase superfamily) [Metabacillus iocasae]
MSTKPHLIALDLDGTLLTDTKIISPRTKKVIEKAKQQGHIVMIATGRPYRSSSMYYTELQLNTPIVNFNGALVHHPQQQSWGVYHNPLQRQTAHHIVEAMDSYNVNNILAEVMDDIYLHYEDRKLIDVISLGNPKLQTGDLRHTLNYDPTSILIHADEAHVDEIRSHLSSVHAEVIEHRRWGAPWHVVEIVRKGLNKAVGLKRVADHYNIPQDRVIAFGDEDNDLEMIEYAGHGIAMANGISALKTIANDITLSNEEDGIAYYLENTLKL